MSTIIGTILAVGQKLFGLRIELAKARQTRKAAVADFLASIAQSIEEASALLKQGTYPHGKCQELFAHSRHMEAGNWWLPGELTDNSNMRRNRVASRFQESRATILRRGR